MKTVHMCVSIRGTLNLPKRKFRQACDYLRQPGGVKYSPEGLREALYDALADGWEVLPMGGCSDFDPKTGCRGHEPATPSPEQSR